MSSHAYIALEPVPWVGGSFALRCKCSSPNRAHRHYPTAEPSGGLAEATCRSLSSLLMDMRHRFPPSARVTSQVPLAGSQRRSGHQLRSAWSANGRTSRATPTMPRKRIPTVSCRWYIRQALTGAAALRFNGVLNAVNGDFSRGHGRDVGVSNALTAFTVYNSFSNVDSWI